MREMSLYLPRQLEMRRGIHGLDTQLGKPLSAQESQRGLL
jgi:hypothetical protein